MRELLFAFLCVFFATLREITSLAPSLFAHTLCPDLRLRMFHWHRLTALDTGSVMRFFFLRRRAGLLERRSDQIIRWAHAVDERKYVKIGGPLAYDLNLPFSLQPRQLTHHKVLLCHAHVAIVDVEGKTG